MTSVLDRYIPFPYSFLRQNFHDVNCFLKMLLFYAKVVFNPCVILGKHEKIDYEAFFFLSTMNFQIPLMLSPLVFFTGGCALPSSFCRIFLVDSSEDAISDNIESLFEGVSENDRWIAADDVLIIFGSIFNVQMTWKTEI